MTFIEWLQSAIVIWGVIILFAYYLYNKFPRVFKKGSGVFKRLLNLKSKKDSKKDKVKNTDEETIDLIMGIINRIDEKHTIKDAIKRIKELVN